MKVQLVSFKPFNCGNGGQVLAKAPVFYHYGAPAGDVWILGFVAQPSRHFRYEPLDLSAVGMDILAGDIGYEGVVTVRFRVKDQGLFA